MSEKESGRKAVIVIVLAFVFFVVGYVLTKPSVGPVTPGEYPLHEVLYGAQVYSKIPPRDVSNWIGYVLFESNVSGALACNLQLSTLKPSPPARPYAIEIERGEKGIFIDERGAVIRGNSSADVLYNCHVLSCLISNVSCPDNLGVIQTIMWETYDLNIVIDSEMSGSAMAAYAELLGPIGFYQISRADLDGDGELEDWEAANNKVFIRPFVRFNDSCVPQPLKNFVQDTNFSGAPARDCDISPAIYIEESDTVSEIVVEGEKIILRGNPITLRAEAMIVGNIIATDWITSFRQAV
ncbi:MAG: hypothetical protein ABH834_07865 [Candidatus Altiarchaeota archaeon]